MVNNLRTLLAVISAPCFPNLSSKDSPVSSARMMYAWNNSSERQLGVLIDRLTIWMSVNDRSIIALDVFWSNLEQWKTIFLIHCSAKSILTLTGLDHLIARWHFFLTHTHTPWFLRTPNENDEWEEKDKNILCSSLHRSGNRISLERLEITKSIDALSRWKILFSHRRSFQLWSMM